VDDQNDSAADTYTVTGTTVQRTGSSGVLTYGGTQEVVINGGSGGVTFNVNSTAAGTPVTLNGGSGNDTFNATPSTDNLTNLAALLTVNGGGGSNALIVDDQNNPAAAAYALSSVAVSRPGSQGVGYGGVQNVTVNGGSGGNAFIISSLPASTAVTLNGGSGTNGLTGPNGTETWTLTGAGAGTLGATLGFSAMHNLTGGTGNDTFTFNGGSIAGTIHGGGGFDTLDYSQSASGVSVNLLAGTATGTGGVSGIHNVTGSPFNDTITGDNAGDVIALGGGKDIVKGGTGNDTFLLSANQLAGSSVTGGGGTDTLIGPNATNIWTISSTNGGKVSDIIGLTTYTTTFTGIANLVGGTGVDVFKFSGTGKLTGTISGGGAPLHQGDWLDYSAVTYAVTVNLATGNATNTGGVSGIQNVHGGNHGNTLTGDGQGNILIGGSGTNTIHGGSGMSILIADKGVSTITGDSTGGDILIGDYATYDSMTTAHELALMSILAEWQSADSYATRFHDIDTGTGGGLNGIAKLNWGTTVKDDPLPDSPYTLTAANHGGAALDWFFLDTNDTMANYEAGEHVNNT
jgi:hypothetical protein